VNNSLNGQFEWRDCVYKEKMTSNMVTFTSACKYIRLLSNLVFAQLWIYAVCRELCVGFVSQQQIGAVLFDFKKKFC
jgi:hypothetical protein